MALRSTRVSSTSPFTTNANGWEVGGATGGQAIPHNTHTVIDFDTVHHDPTSGFSTSTNKFTTSVAGFYSLHTQALYTSATAIDAGERFDIGVYVDNNRLEAITKLVIKSDTDAFSNFLHMHVNGVYYIDAGSTVSARLFQNTGVTQYLLASADSIYWTSFQGCLLAT